jgi:hypothetical protein
VKEYSDPFLRDETLIDVGNTPTSIFRTSLKEFNLIFIPLKDAIVLAIRERRNPQNRDVNEP